MRGGTMIWVWLGVCLISLSGCVTSGYVDDKIQEAKITKFEERLATVESLLVSTDLFLWKG